MIRNHILICGGTGCTSSGALSVMDTLNAELEKHNLQDEVKVVMTGCFGLCALGPIMIVYPEGSFYSRVDAEAIPEIVSEHIVKGRIVKKYLYSEVAEMEEKGVHASLNDTKFYKKQKRVALRNCGVINPEIIDEYIRGG